MPKIKNLKTYLILIAIILISIILLLNDFILYGLTLVLAAGLIFWIWNQFIRTKDKEIDTLKDELEISHLEQDRLTKENTELKNRKLNVSQIKELFDLGLMEINTNFTRTWNEKMEVDEKSIHFIGALRVKIVAKYGIDMQDMKLKFDENENTLQIANIEPKFLSFNDLDYEWEIAEVMEEKQPLLGANHWRKSDKLEVITGRLKEDLREQTHKEIKQGPEELCWLLDPLGKQIHNTLEALMASPGRKILFVEKMDENFKSLKEIAAESSLGR